MILRPTREMIVRFEQRTLGHIERVARNLRALEGFRGLTLEALEERARAHDRSKWSDAERDGYAWLTWKYECPGGLTPRGDAGAIEAAIARAQRHHYAANRHHPEFHPTAHAMSVLDIVEMVSDWHAITQENGAPLDTTREWARRNIPERWSMTAEQRKIIEQALDVLERRSESAEAAGFSFSNGAEPSTSACT